MKTRIKFISCLLALMIIATGYLWAQAVPKDPTSPTNDATVGLTATEIDQFVNVLDWGEVKFDKAFVFMGFEQGTKNKVDLGAAFKVGSLFIGSWYQGNLGVFNSYNDKDVGTAITEGAVPGTLGGITLTAKDKLSKDYDADHSAVMLFGFDNIGIRAGYLRKGENYSGKFFGTTTMEQDSVITKSNEPQFLDSTVYSPKGYVNRATHRPFVDFGMNIPLGTMTLSPTASLEVEIYQGNSRPGTNSTFYGFQTITKKDSEKVYNITQEQKAESDAHVGIIGKLGAGLALSDTLNSVFDLGYEFTVNAYGKNYKAVDGTKHKIKGNYKITTDKVVEDYNKASAGDHVITTTFEADFIKKSYFSNTLRAGYKMQKDFTDRLSLLAAVELPITVGFEKSITEKISKTVTDTRKLDPNLVHQNNVVTKTVVSPIKTVNGVNVTVKPSIKAAVSYAAMPNRVFLNLGTKIEFLETTFTSTKESYDSFVKTTKTVTEKADGSTTTVTSTAADNKTEFLHKTVGHKEVAAELMGGLRWNVVENFAFDLVYSATLLNNPIEWYKFQNLKLACTIKF